MMSDLLNNEKVFHSKHNGVILAVPFRRPTSPYRSCFYSATHDRYLEKHFKIDDKINLKGNYN
jgi:hypothetical protein